MRPGSCEFAGKRSNEIHISLRAKSEKSFSYVVPFLDLD
jgi:hypothetical protein